MLRVEWQDGEGRWHTYYRNGTSVKRTIKREYRRLRERHETVRTISVERM